MIKAVIHCSDSPHGRGDNAATIHKWHKERGFDGIGYHYVILEDGEVENGRPHYWEGAHTKGHNDTIGICLIGEHDFTPEQFKSLSGLLDVLRFKDDEIVAHSLLVEMFLKIRKMLEV